MSIVHREGVIEYAIYEIYKEERNILAADSEKPDKIFLY